MYSMNLTSPTDLQACGPLFPYTTTLNNLFSSTFYHAAGSITPVLSVTKIIFVAYEDLQDRLKMAEDYISIPFLRDYYYLLNFKYHPLI